LEQLGEAVTLPAAKVQPKGSHHSAKGKTGLPFCTPQGMGQVPWTQQPALSCSPAQHRPLTPLPCLSPATGAGSSNLGLSLNSIMSAGGQQVLMCAACGAEAGAKGDRVVGGPPQQGSHRAVRPAHGLP
jgi:hypothetical protein